MKRNRRWLCAQFPVVLSLAGAVGLTACAVSNLSREAARTSGETALITVEDNVLDEGLLTLKITTPSATYFYDKTGGAFPVCWMPMGMIG